MGCSDYISPRVREDLCHTRRSLVVVTLLVIAIAAFSVCLNGLDTLPACIPEQNTPKASLSSVGCYFVHSVCAYNEGASDEAMQIWKARMTTYSKWDCGKGCRQYSDKSSVAAKNCMKDCTQFPGFPSNQTLPPVKPGKVVTCMNVPRTAMIVQSEKGQRLAIPWLSALLGLFPILTCGVAFFFRNQRTLVIAIESTKVFGILDTSMLVYSCMYIDEITFDCRWRGKDTSGEEHPAVEACQEGYVKFAIGAILFSIINAFILVLCVTMGERERRRLADNNVISVGNTMKAVQMNNTGSRSTAEAGTGIHAPNAQAAQANVPVTAPAFKETA